MKKTAGINLACAFMNVVIGMSRIEDAFEKSRMTFSRGDMLLTAGCFFFAGVSITMAWSLWSET